MEVGICEAIDEAESDCDSKEDDPFADIDEQKILNIHYLSAWYNMILLCVSALFKQALIF